MVYSLRKINKDGLNLIKQWEGKKLTAYKDTGGILTIGYGHTSAAGAPKVVAGMKISDKEADEILQSDLSKFEKRVSELVKVFLTENQYAALVSFDYNTGALHKSTLLKKLNAGDYDSVPSELMKWVNVKGKRVKGLVNRRSAEVGLWSKGSSVASTDTVKPEENNGEPIAKSKRLWTWLTAAGGVNLLGFGGLHPSVQMAIVLIVTAAAAYAIYSMPQIRKAIKGLFE